MPIHFEVFVKCSKDCIEVTLIRSFTQKFFFFSFPLSLHEGKSKCTVHTLRNHYTCGFNITAHILLYRDLLLDSFMLSLFSSSLEFSIAKMERFKSHSC